MLFSKPIVWRDVSVFFYYEDLGAVPFIGWSIVQHIPTRELIIFSIISYSYNVNSYMFSMYCCISWTSQHSRILKRISIEMLSKTPDYASLKQIRQANLIDENLRYFEL